MIKNTPLQIASSFLVVALLGADIYSCSCEFWSARKKLRKAKIVFVGEVLSTTCQKVSCQENMITFKVEKYWKGVKESQVQIYSAPPVCCTCGLQVGNGDKVLVFAFKGEGEKLETSLCSSTRVGTEIANKEMRELGNAKYLK